jgi:hypothetical protein
MGIAERIAMITMVTAKSFAILPPVAVLNVNREGGGLEYRPPPIG